MAKRLAVLLIGAAALETAEVTRVLSELPEDLPVPVLLVMHGLTRMQSASFIEALRQQAQLPSAYARDRERIEPGRVYVAPPDRHLLVEAGQTRVVFGPKENCHR